MNLSSIIRRLLVMAALAGACSSVLGQGTIVIANNLGATIYPVIIGCEIVRGSNYSVEVFVNNTDPANKIGATMTLSGTGRFSQAGGQVVPGVAPGAIATMIARAWDNTTGATYETSLRRASTTFKSPPLGGDIDGDPTTPPAPALSMVTGKPDGFSFFYQIPEPGVRTLALLGFGVLLFAAQRRSA